MRHTLEGIGSSRGLCSSHALEQRGAQLQQTGQSHAGEGLLRVRNRADNGYCAATVVQVGQHRFSTFCRDGGPPAGP